MIAFDQDASSVEHHWRSLSAEARASVLPLVMDLTNPSPALGWALEERRSLIQRGPADLVLALALVHHLAIGNNVPLEGIAALFAKLGRQAIVEFVPKEDPMTQHLLAARKDVFPDYTLEGFRVGVRPALHDRRRGTDRRQRAHDLPARGGRLELLRAAKCARSDPAAILASIPISAAYVVRRCRLRGPASVDRDSCVERGAPPGAVQGYAAPQALPPNIESRQAASPAHTG